MRKRTIISLPVHAAPGSDERIRKEEYFCGMPYERIGDMIIMEYAEEIPLIESEISRTFEWIYGRRFAIAKGQLYIIFQKIKLIMIQTGKDIKQIIQEIRRYVGYPCSFFRIEGSKEVPINSERITTAYTLVKQRESIITVENALYF